jgi:hypothetical protein
MESVEEPLSLLRRDDKLGCSPTGDDNASGTRPNEQLSARQHWAAAAASSAYRCRAASSELSALIDSARG